MAGVVIGDAHALVGEPQMARHVTAPRAVAERGLAGRRIEQAELGAELAGASGQPAPRDLEADAVVSPPVGVVAHHPVHPLVGRDARAGEHHAVDGARAQAELAQQRADGEPRVAGVVLQAGEALLGGAGDDRAVTEDGGGRTVRLADAQDDHDATIISANLRRSVGPASREWFA